MNFFRGRCHVIPFYIRQSIPSPRLEGSQVMRNLRVLDQCFDRLWIETLIMSLLRQS